MVESITAFVGSFRRNLTASVMPHRCHPSGVGYQFRSKLNQARSSSQLGPDQCLLQSVYTVGGSVYETANRHSGHGQLIDPGRSFGCNSGPPPNRARNTGNTSQADCTGPCCGSPVCACQSPCAGCTVRACSIRCACCPGFPGGSSSTPCAGGTRLAARVLDQFRLG
jgi:hypothetical protein